MRDVRSIPLAAIRLDGNTQSRVKLDTRRVDDYAEVLDDGGDLPAIDLWHDGSAYWPGDGFHRYHAYSKRGRQTIPAIIHVGTHRDALLYAIGANATHGLPRSPEDKRRAVLLLLDDAEWGAKSVEWIAQTAKVCWDFANKVRAEYLASRRLPEPETVQGRDGREMPARKPREEALPAREVEPADKPDAAPEISDNPDTLTDAVGRVVPQRLVEVFARAAEIRAALVAVGQLRNRISELSKLPGGVCIHEQAVIVPMNNVQSTLRMACPYVVCPVCGGAGCEDAKTAICAGRGWIREGDFAHLTPEQREKCEGVNSV